MIVLLGEMQTMLRDSARDVCEPWRGAAKLPAASVQAAWRQFGELGWTGVTLPEAHGGSGGALLDAGVIALELGRAALFCGYPDTVALATALAEGGGGSPAMFAAIAEGALALRFGLQLNDDSALLGALAAARTLVVGLIHGASPTLVAIAAEKITRRPAMTTTHQADLLLDLAGLDEGEILLQGDAALATWTRAQAIHRALICAELTGAARQYLDMSVEYAGIRVQFDRPIGAFQAVQHALAETLAACDAAELTSFKALAACDRGAANDDAELLASTAFVREAVWAALMKSYDILGGVGYMEDHAFSRYTRGALPLLATLGAGEQCDEQVAATVRRGGWL
jgi:alkylation response protein AidB-like acyl-CoA dehydrogenase